MHDPTDLLEAIVFARDVVPSFVDAAAQQISLAMQLADNVTVSDHLGRKTSRNSLGSAGYSPSPSRIAKARSELEQVCYRGTDVERMVLRIASSCQENQLQRVVFRKENGNFKLTGAIRGEGVNNIDEENCRTVGVLGCFRVYNYPDHRDSVTE